MASLGHGNHKRNEDPDEDRVERILREKGCLELHYAVQECIADTKDWRKCQNQVQEFRKCIEKSEQK